MKHAAVLLDLAKFLKVTPEAIDVIESHGIRNLLREARDYEEMVLFQLESILTQEEKKDLFHTLGSNYTRKQQDYEFEFLKGALILPHANYKKLRELSDVFFQIHYDNPDIFKELNNRPFIEINNELMEKYGSVHTEDDML